MQGNRTEQINSLISCTRTKVKSFKCAPVKRNNSNAKLDNTAFQDSFTPVSKKPIRQQASFRFGNDLDRHFKFVNPMKETLVNRNFTKSGKNQHPYKKCFPQSFGKQYIQKFLLKSPNTQESINTDETIYRATSPRSNPKSFPRKSLKLSLNLNLTTPTLLNMPSKTPLKPKATSSFFSKLPLNPSASSDTEMSCA
ncbi:unnamed protein product [Moneuplotes crassus]|uniref:Uncharacterized protein n=1 Tax=Euplotes crassus TaxID=5936 RepID=A0AAD1XAT9_EUPCR|nr:unnamed protein product [Moneuplotes crassus]